MTRLRVDKLELGALIEDAQSSWLTESQFDRFLKDNWNASDLHKAREQFIQATAFPVYTMEFIQSLQDIIEDRRVLEICAGQGFLANTMGRVANWTATDIAVTERKFVRKLSAREALEAGVPYDIIFVSWPPFKNDLVLNMVQVGKPIIMISDRGKIAGDPRLWSCAAPPAHVKLGWGYTIHRAVDCFSWFKDVPSWPRIKDQTWFVMPPGTYLKARGQIVVGPPVYPERVEVA